MHGAITKLFIAAYKTRSFSMSDLMVGRTLIADFNPSDYTFSRSNAYESQRTGGTSRPLTTYAHGDNDTLDISFMFDGTGVNPMPGPVALRIKKFFWLMKYQGPKHEPPYVRVCWGSFFFKGILKSATSKYVLFNRLGMPLRAKIDAKFEQVLSDSERIAEESRSSPDVDRVWRVQTGDRLDRIALESYGNVAYWRQLAAVNGLSNPRRLVPGSVLSLPRLERSR